MGIKKIAMYGGCGVVALYLYARYRAAQTASAAASSDQSSGVTFSQPSMMYAPSGSDGTVSTDTTATLPDVPATVASTATTSSSDFDLSGLITSLMGGQKDQTTSNNAALSTLSDNSLIASLGITSGSVSHSATGTTIAGGSTGVPAQLQRDFDNFFLSTPAGNTSAWGGGTITKNADGTATYKKPDNSTEIISSGTDVRQLAANDPGVAAQWRVQYNYGT